MKPILNTFIVIIIMGISVFGCFELIRVNIKVTDAENYFETVCTKIENSYFSENKIEECITRAKEKGYKLKVEDESYMLSEEKIPCYFVTLTYDVQIAMFDIDKEIEISGYAE